MRRILFVLLMALTVASLPAATLLAQTAQSVACTDTAQSIVGDAGTTVTVSCPANCGASSIWGTDIYTDDSGLCTAAQHAGVIGAEGGTFEVTILEGQESYPSSERKGITSGEWGSWGRSFAVSGGSLMSSVDNAPANNYVLNCTSSAQAIVGKPGDTVNITCPANCTSGAVWGTDIYTDDSNVCRAAIHAGMIGAEGGSFGLTFVETQPDFSGSERNGVSSSSWDLPWQRNFSVGEAVAGSESPQEDSEDGSGEAKQVVISADLSQTITVGSGATMQIPGDWTFTASPTGAILNSSDFMVFSLVFDSPGLESTFFANTGGALDVLTAYYNKQGAEETFDPNAVELYTTPDGRAMAAIGYTVSDLDSYAIAVDFANGKSGIIDARSGMAAIGDDTKALLVQIAATFSE